MINRTSSPSRRTSSLPSNPRPAARPAPTTTRTSSSSSRVSRDSFEASRSSARTREFGNRTQSAAAANRLRAAQQGDSFEAASQGRTLLSRQTGRVERSATVGGVQVRAEASGPSLDVTGRASQRVGPNGADLNIDLGVAARVGSASASAQRDYHFNVNGEDVRVRVNLAANGAIGADGQLHLNVHAGRDGVSVRGEATGFAGARGTLTGSVDVAVNGRHVADAELSASAIAGVAGQAQFQLGLDGFHASAGAAAGVGFGVDVRGRWDAGALIAAAPGLAS